LNDVKVIEIAKEETIYLTMHINK